MATGIRLRFASGCQKSLRFLFRIVSWIPVIFVCAILTWGYYVYVYVMNISGAFRTHNSEASIFITVVLLVGAHIILCLQLVSWFRTIFTKHKHVPPLFHLMEDQLDELDQAVNERSVLSKLATNLPVNELSRSGSVRYCDRCEIIKPDRAHHCSLCDKCILKMDHHCPWVNNCVGYSNYKFFILFLFYTVVLALWFCTTGMYDFIQAWNGKTDTGTKFNVIFCYFVCSLFGLSTAMLLGFHIYLSFFNRTTLENMQAPLVAGGSDRRLYFMGFKKNIQQVFGSNCLMAFIPVSTSEGDGVNYPTRMRHIELGIRNKGGLEEEQKSEEESEVEIFDSSERLLTATSHL